MRRSSRRNFALRKNIHDDILILLAAGLFFVSSPLCAQNAGKASTTKTPLPGNINPLPQNEALLTLYANGKLFTEDAEALIDQDDPFIKVSVLKEALTPYLKPEKLKEIFDVILSKLEWAGMADLKAAGIESKWDGGTLTYYISTPSESANLQEIDFSPPQVINSPQVFKPSFISALLNLSGSAYLYWTPTTTTAPISLTADGLLKVWKIAFEGSSTMTYYRDIFTNSWNKMRSVVDFRPLETRMIAGRLTGEGISFQARPELYGVSFSTYDQFSRYARTTSPSVAFVLEKPSIVRIVSNGAVLRVLKLDKGNYRVYDLPFTYGLNEFQLEVEDDSLEGIKVYKPIENYISTETGLLIGRRFEYGLSAGVGTSELDQVFGSGYMRYGVSYNFTGGLFFQADARSALGGLVAISGTRLGGISAEMGMLGAWDGRTDPLAYSAKLSYEYTFTARPAFPTVGFSAVWASKGFTTPYPSAAVSDPEPTLALSGNIGWQLSQNFNIGLSGNWTHSISGANSDSGNAGLNAGFNIARGISVNFSSGVSFDTSTVPDYSASLMLYFTDPKSSSRRVTLTQNADATSTVLYTDRIPFLSGFNYSLQAQNLAGGSDKQTTLSANASLATQVGDLLTGSSLYYGGPTGTTGGSANLNFMTAIGFAGGRFAMSRQVSDSFIIFDPDKSTERMRVLFGTSSSGKIASHGWPVMLPISSYRDLEATMDFPEADADVTSTVPKSLIEPEYRSGILYKAGLLKKYYVSGRLLDANGKPITLIAGEILDAKGKVLDTTFTGDDGIFQIYGLIPGSYTIRWAENKGDSKIVLGEDKDGYIELGDIHAEQAGGTP